MKAFLKWLRVRFPDSLIDLQYSIKQYRVGGDITTGYKLYVSNNDIFTQYDNTKSSWSQTVDTIAELKFEVNQYLKVQKEEQLTKI